MFSLPYQLPSYIFSPNWFYGFDSIIEIVAIITCIMLVFYSYKCYKLTSEKRYGYFSIAFLSLTLAFISKVAGTLGMYKPIIKQTVIGHTIQITFRTLTIDQINAWGFLLYIFFTILGFMALFLIVSRLTWKDKRVMALLLYFVLITTWLGAIHYQLFYLTTFAMLSLITYSYFKNYKEIKSKNSLIVAIGFSILLVSHFFFVFVIYSRTLYVATEIIQLLGFLCLLLPFMLIFIKKPKKHKLVK
jgi:hypothetical protein